jgi:hypothetical protein
MKPAIRQIYLRFCLVLRAILTHPDCTKALAKSLTSCVTVGRNGLYDPVDDGAVSNEKAVDFAKAITFGVHSDLEEEDSFAIPLPKPAKVCAPLATLVSEFGEVAGQIIENPDVPNAVSNAIFDICVELANDANHHDEHPVAWAQYFTPHCLALLAGLSVHAPGQDAGSRNAASLITENARLRLQLEQAQSREQAALQTATEFEEMADELTRYAPAVEARRAEYDRLTEALITMVQMESQHIKPMLDLTGVYEKDNGHFIDAFNAHLRVLTTDCLDWFDARTLRKFYTDMRLWHDQFQFEAEQEHKAAA